MKHKFDALCASDIMHQNIFEMHIKDDLKLNWSVKLEMCLPMHYFYCISVEFILTYFKLDALYVLGDSFVCQN